MSEMDEALRAFETECNELLQEMEDGLLCLEEDPDDADSINALFRAAHTIKGTGGVFGFDKVEAFTHVVESLMDQLRDGQLKIDGDMTSLLLSCRDHMQMLVTDALNVDTELDDESQKNEALLLVELNKYLGQEPKGAELIKQDQVASISNACEEQQVSTDHWHISLRFGLCVLKNGMDPHSFIRYLQKLGDIVYLETILDAFPDAEKMDAECCYLGFEIGLQSTESKEEIEGVFDFVREDCDIRILPPRANLALYAEMIAELSGEDLRLGEILVKSGALTQKELEDALIIQQLSETEMPIGEVLVDQQSVPSGVVDVALQKQKSTRKKTSAKNKTLRVDADKLDTLINLVGELVIAGAGTNMLVKKLADKNLLEAMANMSQLVESIRDSSLDLRMVQIGESLNRFKRVVHDVSRDLGKEIKLSISGADTELDKTVVEKISDPLMHLIRNSLDHGIEASSDERIANNKPAEGTLELNAYHDSGSVVIEVRDDGAGLDRDRILSKAIEKELVTEDQELSDSEIYNLIFEPGFSTASSVSNLSGRGVGMDVVKKNITALRGTVDIDSEPGAGTTISIRLPLTLAIIDGFMVGVGDSSYVLPLDMVAECMEWDEVSHCLNSSQRCVHLQDEVLPIIFLSEMFEERILRFTKKYLVIAQYGDVRAGFVVDALQGEFQTVIKPLGKLFQNVSGVSGATILGQGDVAVILDVPGLIQTAIKQGQSSEKNVA